MSSNRRLFGPLFIVAGLIPAGILIIAIWNWNRARSWQETSASIVKADLDSVASGGRRPSTSIKLNIEYQYQHEGSTYLSRSVSPFNHLEVFRSYVRSWHTKLRNASRLKKQVTCYVDPNNRSLAYIDRSFRWGSFLMLSGVSILFTGAGILLVRQDRKTRD